jgi:anhydro-N-acetylmuramic acid kinase
VNASRGEVNKELLRELLSHPYYKRKPPKTTGREVFGQQYTAEILKVAEKIQVDPDDIVATVTELTALTICNSYEFLGPVDEVYLSGGGSRNPHLVSRIEENLEGVKVMDYGLLGFPSEAKEAVLMALLANEYIMDTPSNIPAATGATQKVRLGVLYNPPHI